MTWTNEPEFDGSEGREIVSNGALVATVYNPTDADLIAAAPDLMSALTKLVANWDANHIPSALDDLSPPNLDIEAARAAIAKAKGN